MIPKIIHYCWFGRGEMPNLVKQCLASWHKYMPDWEYRLWNEDNFDIATAPAYVQEAYEARKFAFVSDYVRLWALEQYGGLYLDTDVEVFKPFDDLMEQYNAFAGFEGSKYLPIGTCVLASAAHGGWGMEMLMAYDGRHFKIVHDAQCTMHDDKQEYDLTPNTAFISAIMSKNGFKQNGQEQDYKDLHVFPVDYFCPRNTMGEYMRTENTYCDHKGLASWGEKNGGWKAKLLKLMSPKMRTKLIKLKRRIFDIC